MFIEKISINLNIFSKWTNIKVDVKFKARVKGQILKCLVPMEKTKEFYDINTGVTELKDYLDNLLGENIFAKCSNLENLLQKELK